MLAGPPSGGPDMRSRVVAPANGIHYVPSLNRENHAIGVGNRRGTGTGLVVLCATPSGTNNADGVGGICRHPSGVEVGAVPSED